MAKAERLRRAYDHLERRIAELAAQEELDAIRPDLNGTQIMEILGIPQGRDVGRAYAFLLGTPDRGGSARRRSCARAVAAVVGRSAFLSCGGAIQPTPLICDRRIFSEIFCGISYWSPR